MEFTFNLEALGCISDTPDIWRGIFDVHIRSFDGLEANRSRDIRPRGKTDTSMHQIGQIGASYPKCKVPFQSYFHGMYRVVECVLPCILLDTLRYRKADSFPDRQAMGFGSVCDAKTFSALR